MTDALFLCACASGAYCFSVEFRNTTDTDIDIGYFVPGGIVYNSGSRQSEDGLELLYSIFGGISKDAVCGDGRDGRIVLVDAVQLLLHLTDFRTAGADA